MADTVSTKVIFESPTRLVMQFTNLSDGTGESAVVKVDKSTLTTALGIEPASLRIDKIEGDVVGMEVAITCNRTTDLTIARIGGLGIFCLDYTKQGGFETNTAGDTGDIEFNTNGQSAGDSYNIIIHMWKKD